MERTAREGRTVIGFGVVALWALLSLISAAIYVLGGLTEAQFTPQNFPELPPEVLQNITTWTMVIVPVISVLSPFIWWILVSLLMQLSTRLFGGRGGLSRMLAVIGMACMPFALGALIQIPLTGLQAVAGTQSTAAAVLGVLGSLLGILILSWHMVLVVIGAMQARQVSYKESAGACALSCVGCGGLVLVVSVVIIVIIAVISAAASQ